MISRWALAGSAAVVVGMLVVYWHVLTRLVEAWIVDGNFSHGFLVAPLALYFAWERRARLRTAVPRPSWAGLAVLAAGLLMLLAGLLASESFLTRVSLIVTIAGIIVFVFGWRHLRILAFPLAFLVLMIPLPALIFNRVAFPLQIVASRVGEAAIAAADIPVLREGNVIVLANRSLEVAEACSGIRSLVSLITLGVVYGYFADRRGWVRATLVASTVPIAILANGARVAGTGMASEWYGPQAAEGFFHEFSGWVVFLVAFTLLLGVQQVIARALPARGRRPRPKSSEPAPASPDGERAASLRDPGDSSGRIP